MQTYEKSNAHLDDEGFWVAPTMEGPPRLHPIPAPGQSIKALAEKALQESSEQAA